MSDGEAASKHHNEPLPGEPGGPPSAPTAEAPANEKRRTRPAGWRSRDVMRAAGLVIAMYVLIKLVWFANVLLLTVFMGVLFGLAVSSGVDRLEKYRIRRGVGAALVVLLFFGVLGGFFALMAPTLREQSGELRRKLPEAVEKAEGWFAKRQTGMLGMLIGGTGKAADTTGAAAADTSRKAADTGVVAKTSEPGDTTKADTARNEKEKPAADSGGARGKAAASLDKPVSIREKIESMMTGASSFLFRFVSSTIAVVAGLLLIVFLSIYIAADPDLYRRGVLHLVPQRSRKRAGEVMAAMAKVLRKWLVTQLIAMAVIGGVTTVALLIFKVKAAFALGFIAGLFEFIPTVGPILSAVPAVAMGFLDSPQKAAIVALLYVGIQFLENHILIPLLMKDGMDLPPAITIVAQALMAMVFGFIGLLVAVPMTAAAMVAIRMLYVQDVIGDPIPATEAKSAA